MLSGNEQQAVSEPAAPIEPIVENTVDIDELAHKICEKIKKVVSLAAFNPGHWKDTHFDAVRSFIQGPGRKIIFLYYESSELHVRSVPPYVYPSELMYFVADLNADEKINEDNFNKKVHLDHFHYRISPYYHDSNAEERGGSP